MELESIRAYDAREHLAFNGRRIKEKAFRSLSGLLRGICVDGVVGVSGFLCLGRLFQGQPNEAALCI